ncbi:MAG: tetratricopeptide repeat protein [candidate division KSB1 bacterium]|nr:tetratricopeptide repeat protein [candidate division KSB1 bacterium]MDZ7391525.1 tetratricopeptide repeat protein [candidate division KSB1 bacterium]
MTGLRTRHWHQRVKLGGALVIALLLEVGGTPGALAQVVTQGQISPIEEARLHEAIRENETLLAKYPRAEFTPTVMFQLAELYARKADLEFQRQMTVYEADMAKYDQGLLPSPPTMPRINLQKTIAIATKLLDLFPTIDFKDRVLYRLAMSHLDEGNRDRAREYFDRLLAEAPTSPLVPEADFRLGEYYFERREFQQAITHYRRLLDKWDSPYFEMGLYKLGWSYYNLNDYANAISSFVYLIEETRAIASGSRVAGGNKNKADLRREAIEYIAASFTEFGGPAKARAFFQTKQDRDYPIQIFLKMADIYNARNFYDEAIETYRTMLEVFPFYHDAPVLYKRIVETYERAGEEEKANQAREVLAANFGPGSAWLAQYPEGEIRTNALRLAQEALFELGTYYHAKAQEQRQVRTFRLAIDRFSQYLSKFPHGDKASQVNFLLAECLYEVGDFERAAEAYYQCMTNYEDERFKEQAAYNRILCYYQLCQGGVRADSMTAYIDDFLGSGVMQPVRVAHPAQAHLVQACNDFERFLAQSPKRAEVLMKLGETLYQLGSFTLAVQAYRKVAEIPERGPYTAQAITMIAQSLFKSGQYEEAEAWYNRLATAYADSADYVERAQRMVASSRFKAAEALKGQGRLQDAAAAFARLAGSARDPEVAERALYEAAALFEQSGATENAVQLFEDLPRSYPRSKLVDEALFRAGVLRQSMGQWQEAAQDFVRLGEVAPTSTYLARALFNAGACYENLQDWAAARRVYERYVALSGVEPNEHVEALFKIGDMAFKQGDSRAAQEAFARTIAQYNSYILRGEVVDDYVPAHAQFMIGEILFQDYCRIQLVPPLERNLVRKRDELKRVLEAYKDAAKYKVAEWATAASYRIGLAFEEFVRAFLESPRPDNLTPDERLVYDEKLVQTTQPFKLQALETYRANVRRAEESNIDNEWVAQSRKRLQALLIELGPDAGLQTDDGSAPGQRPGTNKG